MPGGDRTGPAGMGPMTGRAAGYCAGYSAPGYTNPIAARGRRFGYGRGFGFGRGWNFGRGQGFGWRRAGYPYTDYGNYYSGYPYSPELNPKQEADMLKDQAKAMQEDISAINSRIKDLESAAKDTK